MSSGRTEQASGALDVVGEKPVHRAWFIVFATVAAGVLLAGLLILGSRGLPAVGELVALCSLVLVAEQRDRLFGDATSMSSSLVVVMASVVAFRGSGMPVGPLLCGAMAGFYLPHLRDRAWAKVAINSFSMGGAALAAALTFDTFVTNDHPSFLRMVAAALPATIVFWTVNSIVVAVTIALLHGEQLGRAFGVLVRSEAEMLAFAVLGACCGYIMISSPIGGVLVLVVLLVCVDAIAIHKSRAQVRDGFAVESALASASVASVVGLCFFYEFPPTTSLVSTLIAAVVLAAVGRRRSVAWNLSSIGLVSLVAVGAFHDSSLLLGTGLTALVGGTSVVLLRRGGHRRCFALASTVLPALAAGGAASVVVDHISNNAVAALVVGATAAVVAALSRVIVTMIALSRHGTLDHRLVLGELLAECWVIAIGSCVVAAAWYSVVAGLGLVATVVFVGLLLDRRGDRPPASFPIQDLDEGKLVKAVSNALRDRRPISSP